MYSPRRMIATAAVVYATAISANAAEIKDYMPSRKVAGVALVAAGLLMWQRRTLQKAFRKATRRNKIPDPTEYYKGEEL